MKKLKMNGLVSGSPDEVIRKMDSSSMYPIPLAYTSKRCACSKGSSVATAQERFQSSGRRMSRRKMHGSDQDAILAGEADAVPCMKWETEMPALTVHYQW